MEILKISSKSNPNSVAGAIAGLVKESQKAEMQAIGAGALNQAVKAVAIARGFVAPAGVDLVCIPAFAEVEVEGEDRTGIKLIAPAIRHQFEQHNTDPHSRNRMNCQLNNPKHAESFPPENTYTAWQTAKEN